MPRRSLVAELVGPAGAGKTALATCLAGAGATRGSVWRLPRGALLWGAVRALPTLVAACLQARGVPGPALGQIVRLEALQRLVRRGVVGGPRLIVLDEGPIFALAWLQLCGHHGLSGRGMAGWWARTLREWAQALDVVVWIDAPDPILARRIRDRAKPHRVKDKADDEIGALLGAYRSAFARVIAGLVAEGTVRVVRLARAEEPVERAAARLLALLENEAHEH